MRTTFTLDDDVAGLRERARAWLAERINATARVGLAWPGLLAFLRLVTNPRVSERLEHGLALPSTDGDFARFPALRFENPPAGPAEA